jgi:hypothetical protein
MRRGAIRRPRMLRGERSGIGGSGESRTWICAVRLRGELTGSRFAWRYGPRLGRFAPAEFVLRKWVPRRSSADGRSFGVSGAAVYVFGSRPCDGRRAAGYGRGRRSIARRSARYGRGSRPIARRSALLPSTSPISASSAAAWTAVVSPSGRAGGSGRSPVEAGGRRRRAVGTPCGCAGWGRRFGRPWGLAFERAAGARDSRAAGRGSGGAASPLTGRAARLALRRCGRVRGSCPSSSDGRSSAIETKKKRGSYVQPETDLAVLRNSLCRTADNV